MKRKFLSIADKSLEELGVDSYQALWKKAADDGYDGLSLSLTTTFTKAAADIEADEDGILVKAADNVFSVVFSTANEDRHGDIVQQNWDLRAYKKNPVFLDSHDYGSIEKIIGRVPRIAVKANALQGAVEFAIGSPLGALGQYLAENGFLNATSVGFIPKQFDDKGTILKSELLEISAVSVPANSEALFEKVAKAMETKAAVGAGETCECPEFVENQVCPHTPENPYVKPEDVQTETPAAPIQNVAPAPTMAQVVAKMVGDDRKLMKELSKEVQNLVEFGNKKSGRRIHQILREMAERE